MQWCWHSTTNSATLKALRGASRDAKYGMRPLEVSIVVEGVCPG